jgi:hypothetical protein
MSFHDPNSSFTDSLAWPTNEVVVDTTELNLSVLSMYVEDASNMEPDKVVQYMLMLARGTHDDIPKEVDISTVETLKSAIDYKLVNKTHLS